MTKEDTANLKLKKSFDFTPKQLAARYKKAFDFLLSSVPEALRKKILQKGFEDNETREFSRLVADLAESKGKL